MNKGKLNKREVATIERAAEILNEWIDFHTAYGRDLDDFSVSMACNAVVAIVEFTHEECES